MSKIGDKFIFKITKTGLCSDNTNELVCGEKKYYITEKDMVNLKKYQAWTPMSQEKPVEEGMYNVTFDDGFVTSAEWFEGDWQLWADSGEVTAWMPVPEAYKQ